MMCVRPVVVLVLAGSLSILAGCTDPSVPPESTQVEPIRVRPTTGPAAPIDDGLAQAVQEIRKAPDPSSAVAAYARAEKIRPDSLAPEKAYMIRMVELGLPDMAEQQARALMRREPDNGLAWAVIGYVNARQNQPIAALADLSVAVTQLPGNAFVQRTAGQVIAWFDTQADQSQLTEHVMEAADIIRHSLANQPTFEDAYSRAYTAYTTDQ